MFRSYLHFDTLQNRICLSTVYAWWYREWILSVFRNCYACPPRFGLPFYSISHVVSMSPRYDRKMDARRLSLPCPFLPSGLQTKIWPFWAGFRPFLGQSSVILGSLWIILASFSHHSGVVLVSVWPDFWGHFWTIFDPFYGHLRFLVMSWDVDCSIKQVVARKA